MLCGMLDPVDAHVPFPHSFLHPAVTGSLHTDKKENQIFLINREILSGAVAKSYIRKGFLIYEEMRKYFPIYEEAVSDICLCNCSTLNILIYEKNLIFIFISVQLRIITPLSTAA